jgi:hypothetical protein
MLHGLKGYQIEDFYLPERAPTLRIKVGSEADDGLCRLIEDEIPCSSPPHVRGLCRRHLRLVTKLGRGSDFFLPPHSRPVVHGPGNDRPHVYLDKNVLFDACDQLAFGNSGQQASVDLVAAVRGGQVRATVSVDALKCAYNHVRHRAQRPLDGGGKGLSLQAAETLAQATLRTLLGDSTGTWRAVHLDPVQWLGCLRAPGGLSLEDAVEWATWQQARTARAAPTWFITRDSGIPGGVHPHAVVTALAQRGFL